MKYCNNEMINLLKIELVQHLKLNNLMLKKTSLGNKIVKSV